MPRRVRPIPDEGLPTLSGKHKLPSVILSSLRRPSVLVAIIFAAVLGTVAAMVMTSSPPPVNTSAIDQSRVDEAADRGLLRTAAPTPSPTATPSPSKTPTKPKTTNTYSQPSGGGAVSSTGTCKASFYSEGQNTASGEVFDPNAFTAANKTLPFDTRVRVTNLANGKSVVVRINDRGPFIAGRCLDLSRAAFATIANLSSGVVSVKYEVLH
jgi:rare lipoprotein A